MAKDSFNPRNAYLTHRPHPWHGLTPGPDAPGVVTAFVEITPFDSIKYEVDKVTGYLRVDRPQMTSSSPPTLYGFIPRTYCGKRVAALAPSAKEGDGDPLDICVISERPIERAEVILTARVIGGLQMIDAAQADDKIIAMLHKDPIWDGVQEIGELPEALVNRLRHYFLTYKMYPGSSSKVSIEQTYSREHALKVVQASLDDYAEKFGGAA